MMASLNDFELQTTPGLWRWYDQSARQMACHAKTPAEAEAWQKSLRETLVKLLSVTRPAGTALDPNLIEKVPEAGYTRELVVIQVQPGEYMPCYVLVPTGAGPFKPALAIHGHGSLGARGVIGLAADDMEAEFIRLHNYDYARQLALRGYITFAPVLRGFAERLEDRSDPVDDVPDKRMWIASCKSLGLNLLLRGQTLLGLRVSDMMRLIDYAMSRPDVKTGSLACVGLSGGGTVTLFTTALDTRVTSCVVSGYFNTFRDSIMSIDHCVCNYVPGIVQYAEMADVAGLVAPRPLLAESGNKDTIFPTGAMEHALDELRATYRIFGAEDRVESDVFDGGHMWSGRKAYDWLQKWM